MPRRSRAEDVADGLASLAMNGTPATRLGSRDAVRRHFDVSVSTFNEALRIAQSRGAVTSRPGPGGGIFAADPTPMVTFGHSVLALDTDQHTVTEAISIRDALDPLVIKDALWHASPADVADLRTIVTRMQAAATGGDALAFVRANWSLHGRIATVSPNTMLRSLYTGLLDVIESHTLQVLPTQDQPLPEYIEYRHRLHADLVEAIAGRDRARALALVVEHNATGEPTHNVAK